MVPSVNDVVEDAIGRVERMAAAPHTKALVVSYISDAARVYGLAEELRGCSRPPAESPSPDSLACATPAQHVVACSPVTKARCDLGPSPGAGHRRARALARGRPAATYAALDLMTSAPWLARGSADSVGGALGALTVGSPGYSGLEGLSRFL